MGKQTIDGLTFVTARECHSGGCVGVGLPPAVLMTDTKLGPNSPVLTFTAAEWADFTAEVEAGHFTEQALREAVSG